MGRCMGLAAMRQQYKKKAEGKGKENKERKKRKKERKEKKRKKERKIVNKKI